ncbi:hypothetical protein K438DRAFT_1854379 [Mycena galopus ATCC 62051]|nr:hypothetical protein K438DRAFT_1854379 [Mycena galopus ATCC 62051]
MDAEPVSGSSESDPKAINRARFELELEFYLLYFKEKDYARFIQFVSLLWSKPCLTLVSYPHALHHLELLQRPQFRTDMRQDEYRDMLNQKQFDHWLTNRNGTAGSSTSTGDRGEETTTS